MAITLVSGVGNRKKEDYVISMTITLVLDVGNRKKEDCVISMTITPVSDVGNRKKRRLCYINGNNSRFRCR